VEYLDRKKLTFFLAVVFVSILVGQVRAQQATISVVPASYTSPTVGSSFAVNVTVQNVEDLYGWSLQLFYPNNALNGTSVTQGPFLKAGGNSPIFIIINFTDNYNATYGVVYALCTRQGEVPGVNGAGTLATITFTSTSTSSAQILHLADIELSNSTPGPISFTSVDGEVTVLPEFSAVLILPLLVASTIVAVVLRKKSR